MKSADPTRRRFLAAATCTLGGGIGLLATAPALRLISDPAGKTTVHTPTEPLDLGPITGLEIGAPPRRVDVIAPRVTDAWTAANDVLLGAAWIRRTTADQIAAFSAVCPHLGCAIGLADNEFQCPCHDSRFALSGDRLTGPSERGLDPLPIKLIGGRLQLTWIRFRPGGTSRQST